MGIRKWAEFLCYIFPPSKWDPCPFFYRLEGARYLDEPSAMHGWDFQLTHPELLCSIDNFDFFMLLSVHAGCFGSASMYTCAVME
jgi:hypothetical protein